MTINYWFGLLLQITVAGLALTLAEKRVYHRPFAAFAFYVAIADPARSAMRLLLPYAAHGAFGRVLMILDPVLFVGEPIVLALAAIAVWTPTLFSPAILVAPFVPLLLGWAYPRGLPWTVLLLVQIGCQAMTWGAFLADLKRSRRWGGKPTGLSVAIAAALQFAILFGPYFAKSGMFAAWPESWGMTVGVNLALVAVHVSWLSGGSSDLSPPTSSSIPPSPSSSS